MDFGAGLTSAWESVATFVPRLLIFLVVLGVGYAVARALTTLLSKTLNRVGFDKAVERGGIKQVLAKSKYDASDLLSKLAFYAIMLFVITTAFSFFGENNAVSTLLSSVISYLPMVFAAVLIVVVGSAIGAAVREIADATLGSRSYGRTLANVAGAVPVAIAIFAALDQLQIGETITNAVFYAILAALVGVTIIAVGGSGIKPMQKYWEQSLSKLSEESEAIKNEDGSAKDRIAARAEQRKAQVTRDSQDDVDVRERPASMTPAARGTDPFDGDDIHQPRRPAGF